MEENIMQVRYQQNKLWERITFSIRPVAAFGDHPPLFYRALSLSKLVVEEIARSIIPPG